MKMLREIHVGVQSRQKISPKPGLNRGQIISVDLKKSRQNFWNFFENPPPPTRENHRSAPDQSIY